MRIPRMTTRRWRVAFAIAGIFIGVLIFSLGVLICKCRSDHFRSLAEECAGRESLYASAAAQIGTEAGVFANRPDNWLNVILNRETNRDYAERLRAEAERASKEALSWRDLKKKFQRAANRPWEAGPPEPVNIGKRGSGNWRR